MGDDNIILSLGKSEALVLFDLLADFYKQPVLEVRDNAERLALVRLHGAVETALVEPFSEDYRDILSRARADLTRQWGTIE